MKKNKKLIKKIGKSEKCLFMVPTKELMKKILITTMITTNLSFYFTSLSFAAEEENDKKTPAIVPAAAEKIISKYVETKTSSTTNDDSSNSSAENIITDNSESGNGWQSTTTVKSQSGVTRTYRNYKQYDNGNDYWNNDYWEDKNGIQNIAYSGCGPTSVSIALSGYGYDYNPAKTVYAMKNELHHKVTTPDYLCELIKHLTGMKVVYHEGFGSDAVQTIRKQFKAGRPIIANLTTHYVVYLGENSDGDLIISDPGANDGNNAKYGKTLEDLASKGYMGYITIESDENATSSNASSTDSNKTNEDENKKSDSSENSKSSSITGDGKVITTSDYNATGYSGVFQSGTTGKKFREYKQNSSYVAKTYPSFDWTIECGTVTTIIMGSGYSKQANFSDSNRRLHQGGTNISAWLEDYTGQKVTILNSCSQDTLKKNMSDGCIVAIHSPNYSSAGHYMALLDISKDKTKVYLSNPWGGDAKWQRMG